MKDFWKKKKSRLCGLFYIYKLLKKGLETQVWLTISLLLPTHFPCIWYHWKALLFLFTMMCHLLWLRNLGMCSTPEYGGGCKVKCDNKEVKRNNGAFQWYQMQGKWVGNKREIVSQTWVSKLFLRSLYMQIQSDKTLGWAWNISWYSLFSLG